MINPFSRAKHKPTQPTKDQVSNTEKARGKKKAAPRKGREKHSRAPREQALAKPWSLEQFDVPPSKGKLRFHDLNLSLPVMHAIHDIGFQYCSPIQAHSLPHSLCGNDVLGKAQTGTGKTAAFLLTLIEDLLQNPITEQRYAGEARALIIAPTRELVIQIAEDAKALAKYASLSVHTLVGGMDYAKQSQHLHESLVDILVATPGRLLDFCSNGEVYLDHVEVLVIDEADRMLDMGFIPQVRRIVRQTPHKTHRQTLLFSATFSQDVLNLVEQWMLDPVRVEIEPESIATDTVDQHVYLAATDEKYTLLYNLLQQTHNDHVIVFANRRDECRNLHDQLVSHGFKVGLLSGEVVQNRRIKTLEAFKTGAIKVLVATDVAGRGLHVDDISHVVNFTLPEEPEDYVHRIGRTGRAGATGTSISFACEDDAFRLPAIEALLGRKLQCEQPPETLLKSPPPLPESKQKSSKRQHKSGRPQGRSRRS